MTGNTGHRSCSSSKTATLRFDRAGAGVVGRHRRGGADRRLGVGEVGDEVLRDRRHLAVDGLALPVLAISKQDGSLAGAPEIITRGFVTGPGDESLLGDGARMLAEMVQQISVESAPIPGLLRDKVRDEVRRYCGNVRVGARCCPSSWRSEWPELPPSPAAPASSWAWRSPRPCSGSSRSSPRAERSGVVLQHGRYPRPREFRGARRSVPGGSVVPGVRLPPVLVPAALVVLGWHYFWCRQVDAIYTKIVGVVLLFASLSGLLALAIGTLDFGGHAFRAGGGVGELIARLSAAYLNRTGSIIVLLTLLFMSVILATQFSFGRLFAWLMQAAAAAGDALVRGAPRAARTAAEKQRREVIAKHANSTGVKPEELEAERPAVAIKPREGAQAACARAGGAEAGGRGPRPRTGARRDAAAAARRARTGSVARAHRAQARWLHAAPLALLDAPRTERKIDERELMEAARQLEEKCREFAVEGAVVQIHPGPVVTTYEFKPDAGEAQQDHGLADDLCLAMQAESVLIDRLPGKSTVGIQIPNGHRETILAARAARIRAYGPIGPVDARAGRPSRRAVRRRPRHDAAPAHRGSTGTGKSVGLNGMLTSVLYSTPDDVRLIMIDPKRLELDARRHPAPAHAGRGRPQAGVERGAALGREMEERYKTLASGFGTSSSTTATCERSRANSSPVATASRRCRRSSSSS